MHIAFNKINGYIEDNNGNKYGALLLIKKSVSQKKMLNKIKQLIGSENNGSGNSDDKL